MIDRIIESALEHWEELWPGTPHPADLRYVLQSRQRVILFLFDAKKKGNKLVGVIKISRHVEENDRLERSVRLVSKVRQQLDGQVLETVPKAILLEPVHGLSASLEQGLPGEPMPFGFIPWVVTRWHRRNWQAWRQWLTEFQRQTVNDSIAINARMIDEMIVPGLVRALERDPAASHVIHDLQVVARELDGFVIRKVWRYGDAHRSNILICRGRVSGVVDWEAVEADHYWPTSDWFQFAFQYLVELCRVKFPKASYSERGGKAIDMLLQPADSSLTSMIQEQTRTFLDTWGVKAWAIPAFFVTFLARFYWPWDKGALLKRAHTILCE